MNSSEEIVNNKVWIYNAFQWESTSPQEVSV